MTSTNPADHICTADCDPGNCETAHRQEFGWDVVEEAAAFERDLADERRREWYS